MTDSAHIFNPKDDSLTERVSAYRSVHDAYMNAEASVKFLDDEGWEETLGEREEVELAYEVALRSLQIATQSIGLEDLLQIEEQNLLDSSELQELVENKRYHQIRESRDRSQNSHSSNHQQKQ